ncbi:MAG TPA: aromatic ring-hydroxylating dioxygenase subunit alpha [Candidatus Obscuribacterales bacterium]
MLVTQQPVFRRFWYPVMPLAQLHQGPQSFSLLGEDLVLWLDEQNRPAAVRDRCCHRTAKLSLGSVSDGCIRCPYHGWEFDAHGHCTKVPQLAADKAIPATYRVTAYRCTERYGYVWVCLADPIAEIPAIVETEQPQYRTIHEFYEPWQVAGLRVMENELDLAHPTFVHTETFGSADHPVPDTLNLKETDYGIHVWGTLGVVNPEQQQKNLNMAAADTVRTLEMDWFMPFTIKLKIVYPNGLEHIVVNTMTPISDTHSQMVQFCVRNDTEADTPAQDVVAFDRAVTLEDKRILESTDYDVPLSASQEEHMFTDRPGVMIRKRVAALLRTYGEVEQTRATLGANHNGQGAPAVPALLDPV